MTTRHELERLLSEAIIIFEDSDDCGHHFDYEDRALCLCGDVSHIFSDEAVEEDGPMTVTVDNRYTFEVAPLATDDDGVTTFEVERVCA